MEVKPGYTQSDVGVIPEDWRVKLLPEVCRFRGGKAHEQHISDSGRYVCVNSKFISSDGTVRKYSTANFCPAKKGDVLMVMSDLPNGRALAKAYLVDADDTYAVNQRVCALTAYRDLPAYLFYVLNRSPYFLKFDDGVNQTHLLNPVFLKCPLALPPTREEQRSIAEALSDVDVLLGALNRIIAKKRHLKQAAMQQLLTGQTRLPGFQGEWEETTFGKVVRHHAGNSTLIKGKLFSSEAAGLFPAYSASGQDVWCAHWEYEGNAMVVSAVGSRCGKAFNASGKWCAIANTHVVWPNPARVDGHFLSYFINDEDFWQKSGTGQPFVLFTKTFAQPFRLPELPEQAVIAEVLSETDAELAGLEQRRDKTRALKQAMMQELLTGRTRLI